MKLINNLTFRENLKINICVAAFRGRCASSLSFSWNFGEILVINLQRKRGGPISEMKTFHYEFMQCLRVLLILRLHKLFSAVDDVADNVFPSEFDLRPGLAVEREVSHSKTFSLSIFHFPRFGFVYGNFLLHFQAARRKGEQKIARNQRGGIALSDILQ